MLKVHELIEALEPGEDPGIPDDAKVRILAGPGISRDISMIHYEVSTNTVWLHALEPTE